MTVKSQSGLFPALLSNRQYSGTMSTLLYNWPIFAGALLFGVITLLVSTLLPIPWRWIIGGSGVAAIGLVISILVTTFFVYDWGEKHEYDRLAELGDLKQANVIIDITCGKLRGTRGLLAHFRKGHYFLIDIYDSESMPDNALRRAREMEPPLETKHRIYRRPAQASSLPLPHSWADIIYCHFSLHEIQNAADRDAMFAEFARVLKPDGRLLIAEHGRDLSNLVTFGPGALSFLPSALWSKHIANAGLAVHHRERWRGLVDLWVAGRQAG